MSAQQPEHPSRYDRSFNGLIAALVATVVIIAAYVGIRALLRDQPDVTADSVDYLSQVEELNDAGVTTVVYPPTLPPGWRATSVDYDPGTPLTWSLGFVTDDDEFVGIRQEKADVDDLIDTYVDEDADEGDPATVPSAVGDTWQTWTDDGGDSAFLLEDAATGQTVLVYGSASVAQQEAFISTLTTDPLPER